MSGRPFTSFSLKTLSRVGFQTASHHTRTSTPLFTRLLTPRIAPTVARQSIRFSSSFQDEKQLMDAKEARGEKPEKPVEDWQKRAPYKIHESNENFKARYEASCHCGKVKYQLSREEPLDSKLCHCTTCQTQHAAPFQWAAIFHKEDINFSNGHHDLEWYDPSEKSIEHKLPCKVRCSFCHSPIMDEGRNMILLFPSLVHLKSDEDKANFKPRCHMFYGQRVMDIPDGLPKWSGLNDSSDLIEDSPPDLVREHERKREAERKEKFDKGENK
ncbi:glutathione-dependent formaldehyde-activating, GFA, partial [Aureobasidium melanogenum]